MPYIKKLAGQTALYGLSSVVGRLFHYLLVPFYTNILTEVEYGIITELYIYIAFLNTFYCGGMETTYFRFAGALNPAKSYNISMSFLLTLTGCLSTLLIWAAPYLATWMGYPGCERYVYYMIAIVAADTLYTIPVAQLRQEQRIATFTHLRLLPMGLNMAGNIFFLYFLDKAYHGQAFPMLASLAHRFYVPNHSVDYVLISNLVASAVTVVACSRQFLRLRFTLSAKHLRAMLDYAYPLMLVGLASTATDLLSRPMLKYLLPPHLYPNQSNTVIVGVFSASCKLALSMALAIQAFRYAVEPFFFSETKAQQLPQRLRVVMYWFIIAGCILLYGVSANLDLIGRLFFWKESFRQALPTVPYLLLAQLLLGIYYNLSIWFKITNKTRYGVWFTGLGAVTTIVLNWLLVPKLGYWGSVWASVFSYGLMTGACYYIGQRQYYVPYEIRCSMTYIVGTMALVWLQHRLPFANFTERALMGVGSSILFVVGVYLLERFRWNNRTRHRSVEEV